jgi:hypothetical protein
VTTFSSNLTSTLFDLTSRKIIICKKGTENRKQFDPIIIMRDINLTTHTHSQRERERDRDRERKKERERERERERKREGQRERES